MTDFSARCVDEKNRIIHHELLQYLIETGCFMNEDGQLYFANEALGCWENITNSVPNIAIRSFIPVRYQTMIDARRSSRIVADLIDSMAITGSRIRNTGLINTKNGVVDLNTLKLLPHDKKYGFDYVNHFNFIEDARIEAAPHFCEYALSSLGCDSIHDQAFHQLMEVLGYAISDNRSAGKAIILLGPSDVGKSVVLHLLERVIDASEISSIGLHELDSNFRFSMLARSRINLLHELKPVLIKCVDNFKKVVSCEAVVAEDKGKDPQRIQPRSILVSAANTMPDFLGMELNDSLVNRLLVVRYLGGVEPDKVKRNLLDLLVVEIDVIFSVAIKHLQKLIDNNCQFSVPPATREFMGAYARSMNSVALFLEECCAIEDDGKVFSTVLYDRYVNFVQKNGLHKHSPHQFGMQVRSVKGVTNKKIRIGVESLQGYEGIRLKGSGSVLQVTRIPDCMTSAIEAVSANG